MALRVIVEVDENGFHLKRAQHVDMPAPERPAVADVAREGVYAELRNEREEALYQHNLSAQLERGVEVFAPEGEARRVDVGARKQTLMFVLPDEAGARSLVFLRAPSRRRDLATEAVEEPQELARFELPGGASD